MPPHNHTLVANRSSGDSVMPDNRLIVKGGATEDVQWNGGCRYGHNLHWQAGGQSHNNMQPYTTLSCIIALEGVFPSRN